MFQIEAKRAVSQGGDHATMAVTQAGMQSIGQARMTGWAGPPWGPARYRTIQPAIGGQFAQ